MPNDMDHPCPHGSSMWLMVSTSLLCGKVPHECVRESQRRNVFYIKERDVVAVQSWQKATNSNGN